MMLKRTRKQAGVCAVVCASLLAPGVVHGQVAGGVSSSTGGPAVNPNAPRTERFLVYPVKPAEPALRHRLGPVPAESLDGNAAPGYLQSIAGLGSLTPEEREKLDALLGLAPEKIDAAEAEDLAGRLLGVSMDILRQAARRTECDWCLPLREVGFGTLMPELGKFRTMARAVSLRARVLISRGKYDEAVDVMRPMFRLAADLQRSPTVIQSLVGSAIASSMLRQVAEMVRRPDAPSMYWPLSVLPSAGPGLASAVQREMNWLSTLLPQVSNIENGGVPPSEGPAMVQAMMSKLLQLSNEFGMARTEAWKNGMMPTVLVAGAYPAARAWLISRGTAETEVDAMPVSYVSLRYIVHQHRMLTDETVKWFSVPFWQAVDGLNAAAARADGLSAADPTRLFSVLQPNFGHNAWSTVEFERQIAALRTVEALRLHAGATGRLPARLEEITIVPVPIDPTTGRTFEYALRGAEAVFSSPPPRLNGRESAINGIEYHVTLGTQ